MFALHLPDESKLLSGKLLRDEPSLLAFELRKLAGPEKGKSTTDFAVKGDCAEDSPTASICEEAVALQVYGVGHGMMFYLCSR